jgi:uncharacterized protein (TIGR02271 family)
MAQTVIGIFDNAREAQDAIEALVNRGFTRTNIDLSTATASEGTTSTTTDRTYDRDDDNDSGGIGGFFRSLFGDDDDDRERTRRYTEVGSRSSIVTVHAQTEDEAERAADLLDEYGAVDVDERSEYYRSQTTTGPVGNTTNLMDQVQDFTQEGTQAIPVIEENLQVGKRVVETGGVRVRSRIVERPVEENLRLRQERVHVERRPVDRAVTDADLTGFKEGEIELTEHAEVPVVSKEARVVEEVTLGKKVQEHEETIRDTVRRTDVEVEQLGSTETERYGTTNQTGTTGTGRNTSSNDL